MSRFRVRSARAIAVTLFAFAAVSNAALAEERLVMPFRCDASGGDVTLHPAGEQSYRIHGARETQLFSACTPENPDRCRHWRLHRFEIDCGGARVPWLEVAAAGAAQRGRVWVRDGRMSLQMGPVWAAERSEPSFPRRRWWHERRRPPFGDPRGQGAGFERPFGSTGDVVELPPGFAPALGIPMQFVGERSLPATALAAPSPGPGEAPGSSKSAVPKPAKKDALSPGVRKDAAQKDLVQKATPAIPESAREPQVIAAPGGVTATIINTPQVKSQEAPEAPAAAIATRGNGETKVPSVAVELSPEAAPAASAVPQPVPAVNPITTGSVEDAAKLTGPRTLAGVPASLAGIGIAVVLLASSLYLWSRRGERAHLAALAGRDLGAVSLEGSGRGRGLVKGVRDAALVLRRQRPRSAGTGDSASASAPLGTPLLGTGKFLMPATVAEALEVLGASPDASLPVIKKIVDGLRQSWHPDLARSEDDRRVREQRLQQINVAWDILSGRQQAA